MMGSLVQFLVSRCFPTLSGGTAVKRAFATVVVLLLSLNQAAVYAQGSKFPYQAKVVVDETFVRCGAGDQDKFYPTQKLTRDSVVNVLRHDPGGWYMIDPPEGSFNWVPERFVSRVNDSEGVIKKDDSEVGVSIPAWVGSEFGDEASIYLRALKPGEEFTIIGERVLDTTSGPQKMLQIKPPVRDRRWIPGAAVVPVDPQRRQKMNADPYSVPGNAKRPDGALATPDQMYKPNGTTAGVTDTPPIGPSSQLAHLQQLRAEQKRLADIDRRFREMIFADVTRWDLDGIEQEYRTLQDSAANKQIAGQIDMRYPAIERYRRRLSHALEVKQITSQTEMRDAALVARHRGFPGFVPPSIASAGPESIRIPGEAPQLAEAFEEFLQQDRSAIASADPDGATMLDNTSTVSIPNSQPELQPQAPAGNVIQPGSPQNQYIGAGIVQRSGDGADAGYVLMAPSGKILADLTPTGNVQLERFVGQQVGVQGERWSEQEKRDVIKVSALEPVRLRQ
jgi:hypothetical protein